MTPATITAFMDSALPAAGWMKHSAAACNLGAYPWYWNKGKYGIVVDDGEIGEPPDMWSIQLCPHVGEY
jgi:hypothetical protein